MRILVLLASLGAAPALAADTALEVGAHAGVFVFDRLDQASTTWYVAPRVGVWFTQAVGLEVDVGIASGEAIVPGHGFFAVIPQLHVVADPLSRDSKAPVRPLISIGGGLAYKTFDGEGARGADYAHTRLDGLGSVGAGLLVPIVGPLSFRTDARINISGGARTDLYREPLIGMTWTGGLEIRPALSKDRDRDKVPDKLDRCPDDPEDRDGFQDDDGCPDPDNDGDGILDVNDACPDDAEDLDGFMDEDGCPDLDNDEDGLPDEGDRCPDEAGGIETAGCPDADGDGIADRDDDCPTLLGTEELRGCPDTDGDGLRDPDDECPNDPGALSAFGCPDADGDRVPDHRDTCPGRAVPADADPLRSDGCPARVYLTLDTIALAESVEFDAAAGLRTSATGLLNEVAVLLRKYPGIKRVRVEAHTDDRGDEAALQALSQARADAVVRYLVKEVGIEAERLVGTGFGKSRPIGDNRTAAGRAANRRIALTIIEQE